MNIKKLELLKFWTVVITVWAIDALLSEVILLLNHEWHIDNYYAVPYPIVFYSIGFWLGKSMFFLIIPIALWIWYYIEIRKVKLYYKNLRINGVSILSNIDRELEHLISRGILSKEEADNKMDQLKLEYDNELTVNKEINEEIEKLNSLNSLKSLKAIDELKYKEEKAKIKSAVKELKGETGLGLKLSEINNFVKSSCYNVKIIVVTLFLFFFGILLAHEIYEDEITLLILLIQLAFFFTWLIFRRLFHKENKEQRNFWNS